MTKSRSLSKNSSDGESNNLHFQMLVANNRKRNCKRTRIYRVQRIAARMRNLITKIYISLLARIKDSSDGSQSPQTLQNSVCFPQTKLTYRQHDIALLKKRPLL